MQNPIPTSPGSIPVTMHNPVPTSPDKDIAEEASERDPLLSPSPPLESDHHHHHSKHFHMHIAPTVYCTILYAPSINRIKTGSEWGRPTRLAMSLVALNLILQVGMLRIMDIYGRRDAQDLNIMEFEKPDHTDKTMKEAYMAFLSPPEKSVLEQPPTPLCTVFENGTLSCRPPSTTFTSRWASLDTNGDGEWTMAEAASAEEKYVKEGHKGKKQQTHEWIMKRPTLIFNSIVSGLIDRSRMLQNQNQGNGTVLYLDKGLKDRKAIRKAYFDYWTGDAMMCTRFDRSTCESVVASGLFDTALTEAPLAAASKGIINYDSAVRYCKWMLEVGGGCEKSLPVSFSANVDARQSICGSSELNVGSLASMTNPADQTESLPVMQPNFSMLERETSGVSSLFLFFKILLMYMFYSSVLQEMREQLAAAELILRFPSLQRASDPGGVILEEKEQGEEGKKYRITGISRKHRGMLAIIFLFRVLILCMLVRFGSVFLLNESRYIELVMNAVSLAFITGVDEMLYDLMEAAEINEGGFEDVETISMETVVPSHHTWCGYFFRKECWGLFIVPVIAAAATLYNAHVVRMPRIEAMNCACLSQGDRCAESMVNQHDWWKHYWSKVLPAAIHHIEALRLDAVGSK